MLTCVQKQQLVEAVQPKPIKTSKEIAGSLYLYLFSNSNLFN